VGVVDKVLKPFLVQRHSQLCLYITLAQQILCYSSEARYQQNYSLQSEIHVKSSRLYQNGVTEELKTS